MDELRREATKLSVEIKGSMAQLGIEQIEKERDTIRGQMQQPDFWKDSQKAQELSKKEAGLSRRIEPWRKLLDDTNFIAVATEDKSFQEESLKQELDQQKQKYEELKKELRFTGSYDDHDAILSIYAGAGGTDAQDWAQMLLRMYSRWAEANGIKLKTVDQSPGEEAGLKSVTVELSGGDYLYGKLAGEHGVHRLVRKSPFNAAGSRETSFARVEVLPAIDKPEDIQLDDKDLKIDVYRAGGHGGQSVNTTDSAVRITHIPTGISVAIQNERSQLQNKETAMKILRSKLVQLQAEQHAEKLEDLKGPDKSNEWGSQIRNYVLDDRILKDLRTGYESHDPQKVLDGDLEPLINAWLERPQQA